MEMLEPLKRRLLLLGVEMELEKAEPAGLPATQKGKVASCLSREEGSQCEHQ
jgi:hypothetical protein